MNCSEKKYLGVLVSHDETASINNAWKRTECLNRTEWLKKAINAYAGEKICD